MTKLPPTTLVVTAMEKEYKHKLDIALDDLAQMRERCEYAEQALDSAIDLLVRMQAIKARNQP